MCIIKNWNPKVLVESQEKIRTTLVKNLKDDENKEGPIFIACKQTCEKWVFVIGPWI